MAARVIGLDIGTFAVRAAEMTVGGGPPTLLRYGQVTLPRDAVRGGEVVDTSAVAGALRRLWSGAGFKGNRVILGVGNPRVVVRQAEVLAMNDKELASALRYEAQALIPIPLDDALLDFQVLERFQGPEGEQRMRVLVVAAHRQMVQAHLAAVEAAGLSASAVDLAPFALVRALSSSASSAGDDEATGAEAIVGIGGGVTTVVVHERGVTRFVRVLQVGGDDLSDAISEELGVDPDTAEGLKRWPDELSADSVAAEAAGVVRDRLHPVLDEIRGSLDYYLAQPEATLVSRVVLSGGGSRVHGVVAGLEEMLGLPVELGRPFERVRMAKLGLTADQLAQAEPSAAVSVGLALGAGPAAPSTRRLSLQPEEVGQVRRRRRQAMAMGAGVASLAALLAVPWHLRAAEVERQHSRAEWAGAQGRRLQQDLAELGGADDLDAELRRRQSAVRGVLADDIDWPRVLTEVKAEMPADVRLVSFNGQKAGQSLTFTATGSSQDSAAAWLLDVGRVESLRSLWVSSSTKGGAAGVDGVNFTSTATLTDKARSERAAEYERGRQ